MKPIQTSLLLVLLLGFFTTAHADETELEQAQARIAELELENEDLRTQLQATEQEVSDIQQLLDNHEVDKLKAEMEPMGDDEEI